MIVFVELIIIVFLLMILNIIGLGQSSPEMMGLAFFVSITFILFHSAKKILSNSSEKIIFWLSYILKIGYLVYIIHGVTLGNPSLDSDAGRFWDVASMYYHNDFQVKYTAFPYLLNWEFHIFGKNIACCLLVNIFSTMITVLIIFDLLNKLGVGRRARLISGSIICFMPYIIVTSLSLLRESYYLIFIAFSELLFYIHLKYKDKAYLFLAVMSTLPVLIMHIGYFPLPMLYFIFSMKHNNYRRRNEQLYLLCEFIVLLLFIYLVTNLNSVSYIFNNNTSSVEDLLKKISGKTYHYSTLNAGSVYLIDMQVSSWDQAILFFIMKVIYYLFSPLPTNWRGFIDVGAFVFDSLIHFYVLIIGIKFFYAKKKASGLNNGCSNIERCMVWIGLWQILTCAVVFALGTSTAGTAIRHRDALVAIEVVILAISLNTKRNL